MSSDPLLLLLSPARPPDSRRLFSASSSSTPRRLSLPSIPIPLQESSSPTSSSFSSSSPSSPQEHPCIPDSFPTPKGIILSDASLAEKRRSLETGKRAKKRVSFQSLGPPLPSPSPSPSPPPPRNRAASSKLRQRQILRKLDDLYANLYHHSLKFSELPDYSLSSLPAKRIKPTLDKMLQVTNLVSSISDILEDQPSPSPSSVGDLKHQLNDIESMLTTLNDQQTSAEELDDLQDLDGLDGLDSLDTSDIDLILDSLPQNSTSRPRSLTLPSKDTHTFTPGHSRSQSVTASPATYLPSSTSDFPSPPSTPPVEDTESNARYDRIVNLLSDLIGEGKEALESEGADILHRKTSFANIRRHSRGNSVNVSEAVTSARPLSRVSSRSSGRSSRLSMRSDNGSHAGSSNSSNSSSSGSSDEGESNNNNNNNNSSSSSSSNGLRRASIELDAESDLSDFTDDAAMSPGHSRSSSMSDAEANYKVEAFRRSLHELDRVDVVADYDTDEVYDDEEQEEEGVEEGGEDVGTRSPTLRLSHPSSPLQTHPRPVFQSFDDASPSHNVEATGESDDEDLPLSAYMNSPSRNNGRVTSDLSAENPLLQSIKRVDTNLRRIERLSLELFHDEDDEIFYGEDDFDEAAHDGETVEDAETIAVRDKFLASMRSTLRRKLARFFFESLFFVFAYLVCSPFLIGIAHDRVIITVGLVFAVINQLNYYSRPVWPRDSTELPGWYPVNAIGQLVKKSFHWNDEGERPGLYSGLGMHSPAKSSYAKTRLHSPQHTLQRALPQSSLRNSFVPVTDVQHHHHHFTCDHCLQKLEIVADHAGLDQERVGDSMFEGESVVRLARYEQMPGRRSRRMSV